MDMLRIYTTSEAGRLLGCAARTAGRGAKTAKVGVYDSSDRLVGIRQSDLPAIKACIHEQAGNPNWIRRRRDRKSL